MRGVLVLSFVLLFACDDGGDGVDCREQPCPANSGLFCDRVGDDTFRCVRRPDAGPTGPFLNVDPGEGVEFPRTQPGAFEVRAVQLRQRGDLPVTVTGIYLFEAEVCDRIPAEIAQNATLPEEIADACDFVIDWRPDLPVTLASGDFRDLAIRYKPRGGDLQTTWLVVESDDIRLPTQNVPLNVQGDRPRFDADDERIVFSAHRGEQTAELTISNLGTAPMQLERAWLDLETDPYVDPMSEEPVDEITVDWGVPELPTEIPVGGTLVVTVRYIPLDVQPDTAVLNLVTNDPDRRGAPARVIVSSAPASATLLFEPNPLVWAAAGQQAAVLKNADNPPLEVLDLWAEPEGVFIPRATSTAFELRELQTHELFIDYVPSGMGGDRGVLHVLTNARNAGDDGEVTLELRGPPD